MKTSRRSTVDPFIVMDVMEAALGALDGRAECEALANNVYAVVSELTTDSRAFCAEILQQAGVAVTPGADFDPKRGAQTLRFSYARSTEDMREGLRCLAVFMKERQQ